MRQEIAVRLHARLYPGGEGPSKVRQVSICVYLGHVIDRIYIVLVELHQEKVHGQEPVDVMLVVYCSHEIQRMNRLFPFRDTSSSMVLS